MDLLRLLVIVAPVVVIGTLMWVSTLKWRSTRNTPLRREIEAQVCYTTILARASIFRKSAIAGTRGRWTRLQGRTKRLTVGTSAFIITAPQALKEFAFRGCDCSIAVSQAPSRFINRDWIVITGQSADRQVRVAIAHRNLPEVWQALAGTGATPVGQLSILHATEPLSDPTSDAIRSERSRCQT